MIKLRNIFSFFILTYFFLISSVLSDVVKKINVSGNNRIAEETIILFSKVNINDQINEKKLNSILKNLYETNFFEDVVVSIDNDILNIIVVEQPLIQNINFTKIKSKSITNSIRDLLTLRSRSSFNKFILSEDLMKIKTFLKSEGYYFSVVTASVVELDNNMLDLNYEIELNKKAKISKIIFTGNKVYKDKKLRRIIASEEYKFWKFISGRKFLNEDLIKFDERLLTNFYKNKGYYDIKINSSFARLNTKNEFELIFNINAEEKFYFNDLKLNLPPDYNIDNFSKISELLKKTKNEPYSLNSIENILDFLDEIIIGEQFEAIKASVTEKINDNKIDLTFNIEETEKFFIERINLLGNNITDEKVIRNQLIIDEGDPYNEILQNKSINNIKNLNFFKSVKSEVLPSKIDKNKIINIVVEEKATGEILAGAGVGTSGGTVTAAVKENNFLGKGIGFNASLTVSEEDIKGSFSANNPNFRNTDKEVYLLVQTLETNKLDDAGYKTNKTGFEAGTSFEYYDDVILGLGFSNFYERISTNSNASVRQKLQKGNYWDSFLKLNLTYDKRNQKFQTTKGFVSRYSLSVPTISDTNTLNNSYSYRYYTELYDENVSSFGFSLNSAFSIDGNNIKLSERLFIPSKKLRGFELGKIGPKDNKDFVGGNYSATLNFSTTLPQILANNQNTDFLLFMDFANLWGVDYDSSIDDAYGNSIRGSIGIGVDWFTPIGPLNMSLTQPLLKENTDITETFRFNIGTTF